MRRGVDAGWCLLAFAALWTLTRTLPGLDPIAPFILLVGGSVVLLALVDGPRSPVVAGIPALMFILLLAADARVVVFLSGIALAGCLAIAGWRWTGEGRLALDRAVVLLLGALLPAVLVPSGTEGLAAALTAIAGAVALVVVAADIEGGRELHWREWLRALAPRTASPSMAVGIDTVTLAYCAALAAPAVPARASLFVFVVAAMVLLLRRPGAFTAGAFVLVILAAGKWYIPVLLAVAIGFAVHRLRASRRTTSAENRALAIPPLSGIPVAAISTMSVAPDVLWRARNFGPAASVAALVLVVGSLAVQPSLATMYVVAAIACALSTSEAGSRRWSPALVAFALAMSGLTGWSGSLSGAFPLPLPFVVVVLLGMTATVSLAVREAEAGSAGRSESGSFRFPGELTSAMVAGLAAAVVLLHPAVQPRGERVASDLRLTSGQSVSIELPSGVTAVRLELSGGNVAGLGRGASVGRVLLEPSGEVRELRIGDFADWGVGRRQHFLSANNPRPLVPTGAIFDEGREAFRSGGGLVRFEVSAPTRLTIEALPAIGEKGRLTIESVEVER